jgi:Rho termination factor, N-terminal domain
MFDLINPIDTALRPIEELHYLGRLALPHLKTVQQIVMAEKTQRILRAIGLAVLVMVAIILCGMLELGRLAVREATITFQTQLGTTVAKSDAAEMTEGRQLGEEALISRQTGVRQLRQVATQRGIRNAGRMRKPELLVVLELR